MGTHLGAPAMMRDTYQKLTSIQAVSNSVAYACYNKTSFMKALALEAFGVEAVKNVEAFGASAGKSSGRLIKYESGVFQSVGMVGTTGGTTHHVDRLGAHNPFLHETGDETAYAWHELWTERFLPVVDVEDNSKSPIKLKAKNLNEMKQDFVRDINYCFLGHASAPDTGVMGPSKVYSDLPNLISVAQTRTVMGIAKTNAYWKNGVKAIASIGGGGEMDRPLVLRRSWLDALNDRQVYAESVNDYLHLCSQGAWQYVDRLCYADTIMGRNGGAMGGIAKYDAAGIQHFAFNGGPVVWDPAVTVPYNATASTESIYDICIPHFAISIRSEANFKVYPWEAPRVHDLQKTEVAAIRLRYTPTVDAMRPHNCCYNLPACPD